MGSTRQQSLMTALRKATTPAAAVPEPERDFAPKPKAVAPAPVAPVSAQSKPAARVGKPVQFWMHEEDRKIIRELSAWLAGQGIRPSDSMVVRAALRSVKTGPALLEAYRAAAALDGRFKAV